VANPKLLPLQGKTIAEIAKLWGKHPFDTIFGLLIEDQATSVAIFMMPEPDIALALRVWSGGALPRLRSVSPAIPRPSSATYPQRLPDPCPSSVRCALAVCCNSLPR
jgi:hypothetical protein